MGTTRIVSCGDRIIAYTLIFKWFKNIFRNSSLYMTPCLKRVILIFGIFLSFSILNLFHGYDVCIYILIYNFMGEIIIGFISSCQCSNDAAS
jgi:hypothetical protein